MQFKDHKDRFMTLLALDNTSATDRERQALFWLLSSHTDLYNKVKTIYDFENSMIRTECFDEIDLTSSQQAMVKLGFSLYNSYNVNVADCFYMLDDHNFEVAMQSIRIRYNKLDYDIFGGQE